MHSSDSEAMPCPFGRYYHPNIGCEQEYRRTRTAVLISLCPICGSQGTKRLHGELLFGEITGRSGLWRGNSRSYLRNRRLRPYERGMLVPHTSFLHREVRTSPTVYITNYALM